MNMQSYRNLANDGLCNLLCSLIPCDSSVSEGPSPQPARAPSPAHEDFNWHLFEANNNTTLGISAQEGAVSSIAQNLLDWLDTPSVESESKDEEHLDAPPVDDWTSPLGNDVPGQFAYIISFLV